jgi:hypothetical protein
LSKESATYEVLENLRRIERARAQAWGEAHTREAQLRSLEARVEEAKAKYGPDLFRIQTQSPSRPSESCGLSEIEIYVTVLRARQSAVEGQLGRAIATAEMRLLLTEIAARAGGKDIAADDSFALSRRYAETAGASRVPPAPQHDRTRREEEVVRILNKLPALVPADERRDLERFATEIIQEPYPERVETLALELRHRVQGATERAENVARAAERAAALRVRLRGLEGEDVTRVTEELVKVEKREIALTDALVRRAEAVEQTARIRANQTYAAEVIREELQRLGYEVDEEFTSLFIEGGEEQLRKAGARDYRVLFDVEPATGRIHGQLARLVRPGEHVPQQQQLRDREIEEEWCRDFAQLRKTLERRHVAIRVVRRVPAGSQPIQIIDRKESESRQRRRVASRTQTRT